MKKVLLTILAGFIVCCSVFSQSIIYSLPDKEDSRNISFDIIGKFNDRILVLKNYRDARYISTYDADMKMSEKFRLTFLPNNVLNVDVIAYKEFFYLFYQYQQKNIFYCMVAKMNGEGKLMEDPLQIDTTTLNYNADKKIYTVLNSENKQLMAVMKINAKNDLKNLVTFTTFDKDLQNMHSDAVTVTLETRNDFLTEFVLDNKGDIAFLRATGTSQNDNISKLVLFTKSKTSPDVSSSAIDLKSLLLNDVRLKVDNANNHYLITSFYSRSRKSNIEGLYTCLWNKDSNNAIYSGNTVFNEELRNEAKGENSAKTAFNNFFLQNIVMRNDGGFVIASESVYTTTNNNSPYNNMYGSPYGYGAYPYGGGYWSPYGYGYPWSRYGSFNYQTSRFYAENVIVLSFDVEGKMEWANVINKTQYDDNSDSYIGYANMTTGNEIHFLYNQMQRKDYLLTDQIVDADGKFQQNHTLRNLDKGYTFMPRLGKQTGNRQIIIPCDYRGYLCFAKVEL